MARTTRDFASESTSGTIRETLAAPRVSIVTPVLNMGRYLAESLCSAATQTMLDWEMILVDDGSTDDSPSIAREFQQRNANRVTLITHDRSKGVSAARNAALKSARGEFVAFLDADDVWEASKIEKQVHAFNVSPFSVGMIHTGVTVMADGAVAELLRAPGSRMTCVSDFDRGFNRFLLEQLRGSKGSYFDVLKRYSPICLSSVMIRSQVMRDIGGFDEGLSEGEDWLVFLQCALICGIRFLDERLVRYRIHPENSTMRRHVKAEYPYDLLVGRVHDRCAAFARRRGISLSYRRLRPPPGAVAVARWRARKLARGLAGAARAFRRGASRREESQAACVIREHQEGKTNALASGLRTPELDLLILFATGNCNLSCGACFYRERLGSSSDMSCESIAKIAETCGQPGLVMIGGGEPFLRKDIDRVLSLFLAKSNVNVNSNGFFTSRMVEICGSVLRARPSSRLAITISVDGFEAMHNSMRGNSRSYLNALDSLRALSELRKEFKGLGVGISSLIAPENLSELPELAKEFAFGFDLDYHNFEIVRSDTAATAKFRSNPRALRNTLRALLAELKRRYPRHYLSARARFGIQFNVAIHGADWGFPCLAGTRAVTVYEDGRLATCEMRGRTVDLGAFDYDLSMALDANVVREEIAEVAKGACYCTHGCWLIISMNRHLFQTYGTRELDHVLRYEKMLSASKKLFGSTRPGWAVAWRWERLKNVFR